MSCMSPSPWMLKISVLLSQLIEFLDLLSENGIYAFTNGMIRNIFPGEPEENLKKTLSRAVSGRVIERACRGVYLYARANSVNVYKLESVAAALRGGKYSYVSLETALSEYGIISQMTLGHLTVMTTGRSQKYATPHGTIEFTHTSRPGSEIVRNTFWQDGRPLRVANPETAFEDLRRVGRNIHMVDMEAYREVIRDRDSID